MYKIRNKFVIISFFALLFCYCKSPITFEYLDITCSVGEKQTYFSDEYIGIFFSHAPERNDAEQKIRLYEGGSAISIDFNWQGSAVSIRPHLPWQKGQYYTVDLQGMLKMEDERTYTANLYRTFIYGEEGNSFELITYELYNDALTFQFSRPVLITSFYERFSITPFTEYYTDFSDNGSTVVISPKNGWSSNTTYSWSIRNLISSDGYLMKKEYSGLLNGIPDTRQPALDLVCPVDYDSSGSLWFTAYPLDNYLLENQAIGFSFSKPMDESSVAAGISFYPSISGYFVKETETRFIFIPNDIYQLRREYRIAVAENIKDTSGLALYEPQNLFFTTAGQFLRVTEITFDDNITPMPTDGTIINYMLLPPVVPDDPVQLKTVINFSTVIPLSNRYNAVNTISLNVIFPDSASSPSLTSAYWLDGGSRLSVEWDGFTVSSGSIKNYYMLKVGGGQNGVKNQANEYMEEDVCVIFIAF